MTKYTLTPKIRGFVEWQLEHYLEDRRNMENFRDSLIPSGTAQYGGIGGGHGSGVSNPTERAGIKLATNPYILHMERSCKAIENALKHCDSVDMRLIDLIYWKRSHTVTGAGIEIGLTKTPAYYRVNKILCRIAKEMGFIGL